MNMITMAQAIEEFDLGVPLIPQGCARLAVKEQWKARIRSIWSELLRIPMTSGNDWDDEACSEMCDNIFEAVEETMPNHYFQSYDRTYVLLNVTRVIQSIKSDIPKHVRSHYVMHMYNFIEQQSFDSSYLVGFYQSIVREAENYAYSANTDNLLPFDLDWFGAHEFTRNCTAIEYTAPENTFGEPDHEDPEKGSFGFFHPIPLQSPETSKLAKRRKASKEECARIKAENDKRELREMVQRASARKKAHVAAVSEITPRLKKMLDLSRKRAVDVKLLPRIFEEEADMQGFEFLGSAVSAAFSGHVDRVVAPLEDTLGKLNSVIAGISSSDVANKVAEAAMATEGAMGDVSESASAFSSIMKKITDFFSQMLETLKKWFPTVSSVCLIVALIYWACCRSTTSVVLVSVLGVGVSAVFGQNIWLSVRDFFLERINGSEGPTSFPIEEEADMEVGVAGVLPKLLSTVFVAHSFGADKKWIVDKLVKRVNDAPRTATGISEICAWVFESIRSLVQGTCKIIRASRIQVSR
jgi:hypothetical protein